MSSQSTCNALCISGCQLVKCNNITGNKFCNEHNIQYKNKDDCAICFEQVNETIEIPLQCGHWFHKDCINPTNLHQCPLCKQNMNETETSYFFGENHVEQNNYNDGRSIYYNYQEYDQNAYSEFGHGEFLDESHELDESDERFNEFEEDTRINLLDCNESDLSMEEIHSRINRINEEGWGEIVNDIARNCDESELFTTDSILSYSNSLNDEDYKNKSTEYINEFINSVLMYTVSNDNKIVNLSINDDKILDYYWCGRNVMINYINYVAFHRTSFERMLRIMYNLEFINSPYINTISQIKYLIKMNFLNIVRKLERTNVCPPYIRRQMSLTNQN